jgi:hypothetical protein
MLRRSILRGLLRLVFPSAMLLALPAAVRAQDDRVEVLAVVTGLFDAMARGDTAGMRTFLHPEGRIVQTGFRDETSFHRLNTVTAFLSSIGGVVAQGRRLEEKVFDPEVRIDDNLAQVWARYEFYVDGTMSHCGVDSYHVIRTADGWRILEIVDTQRRPCR